MGVEEKQGKLRGVRGGDGGVLYPSPHGENTRNSPATDQGGRRWWRGTIYIQGLLSTGTEVGGNTGRWMPEKEEQPRET